MLNLYIKEFVAIAKHLQKSEGALISKDERYCCITKLRLIELLLKNNYETPENKLSVWKSLNWISTDPNRITRRKNVNGKATYLVFIDLKVAETLQKLSEHI